MSFLCEASVDRDVMPHLKARVLSASSFRNRTDDPVQQQFVVRENKKQSKKSVEMKEQEHHIGRGLRSRIETAPSSREAETFHRK